MMALMVRFVIVLISFVFSATTCATVFFVLKQGGSVEAYSADPKILLYGVGNLLLEGIKVLVRLGPHYVLSPVLVIVFLGFLLRIRTLFYYIPAGGLASLAIPVLVRSAETSVYQQPDENNIFLYLVSGAAAGFVYWLIGGANAVPERGVSFF